MRRVTRSRVLVTLLRGSGRPLLCAGTEPSRASPIPWGHGQGWLLVLQGLAATWGSSRPLVLEWDGTDQAALEALRAEGKAQSLGVPLGWGWLWVAPRRHQGAAGAETPLATGSMTGNFQPLPGAVPGMLQQHSQRSCWGKSALAPALGRGDGGFGALLVGVGVRPDLRSPRGCPMPGWGQPVVIGPWDGQGSP